MGGGGGSPPSSPPPSSPPPSSPGGNGGGSSNKSKCSKCGVNDAEHNGVSFGGKKIYDGLICKPCANELLKCQICKQRECEGVVKDGSNDILICEICFKCSKCKTNQAVAQKVVSKEGEILYQGSVCEPCIRQLCEKSKEVNKCKVCSQEIDPNSLPMMMPDWAFEKPDEEKTIRGNKVGGKPIMCWPCVQNKLKEEKQTKQSPRRGNANLSLCKGCNKELPWKQEGSKIITNHIFLKTCDNYGNRERHGGFCRPCAEEFKRQHQQTCSQCGKREWPEIKKGWALDFENQKIFCSYSCRFAWLEKQEQFNDDDGFNLNYESHVSGGISGSVCLPLDEVELSDDGRKNLDWEKEVDKKEIQNLREFSKELKRKMDKSKNNPELSEKEKKMAEYFLKLVKNSEEKAEKDFEKSYGKSELEALLANSNQEQRSKKNYWPLAIGVGLGVVGLIGGLVYYFLNKKKASK